MDAPATRLYAFGDFQFAAASGELRHGEATTRLSPHLATILETLLERPGEIVTRKELTSRVWPEGTHVDYEHSLTVAVKKLREALGDEAHSPRFVETLPRRGYRWLTAVQRELPARPAAAPEPRPERRFAGRRAPWLLLPFAAGLTTGAALLAVLHAPTSRPPQRLVRPSPLEQLSTGQRGAARQACASGRALLWRGSERDSQSAIAQLQRAIALDAGYATAHAALATALVNAAVRGHLRPRDALPQALQHADEAIRLEPTSADARVALGNARLYSEWRWQDAEHELRRALETDPHSLDALRSYGRLLRHAGRFSEALAVSDRLALVSPVTAAHARMAALLTARRYREAITLARDEVQRSAEATLASVVLAASHAATGECAAALDSAAPVEALLAADPENQVALAALGWIDARCGRRSEAQRLARALAELGRGRWVDPISVAAIHGELGHREQALALVRDGIEERSPVALTLRSDPMLDALRGDPRFEQLLVAVPAPPAGPPPSAGAPGSSREVPRVSPESARP